MNNEVNPVQIKYPFNGRSKYLIDKFCIIGFDQANTQKIINNSVDSEVNSLMGIDKNDKEKKSSILTPFYNPLYCPILLSEICSDYEKEIYNFDIIKDLIFPNGCKFYVSLGTNKDNEDDEDNFSEKEKISNVSKLSNDSSNKGKNKIIAPEPYNVIFSSNPQIENNSKKSVYSYAFVFYVPKEISKADGKIFNLYIPFTFCIISEYPFYHSFYLLCNQIYKLIKKRMEIPLEIILYNIVNFTPSPLNNDVFLNLEVLFSQNNTLNRNSENNNELSEVIIYKNNKHGFSSAKNVLTFGDKENNNQNKPKKKEAKTLDNLNQKKNKKISSIKFEVLSGYPLIQYNLAKVLLSKMSPEDVITIFYYTFLERCVIFFSKDIEYLSLTIDAYINLNFPLNDEKYYFNNVSISFDNFITGRSNFVGTTFTCIIGINNEYRKDYKSNHNILGEHLTVDLDNGDINMECDDGQSSNDGGDNKEKETQKIFKFFEKIYKNKEMKDNIKNTILYKETKNIFEFLSEYKKKFSEKNEKVKKDFKYLDYDDSEESATGDKQSLIKQNNMKIQEAFYSFVNNLCIYFYENLTIKSGENLENKTEKIEKTEVIFNDKFDENNDYINEEISFLKELRQTMKFQSFVFGFIKSYNPIDLYKIPLTFTEEFLSMLSSKSDIYKKNKNKIKFLSLIDSIYKENNRKEYTIDFMDIYDDYLENYKSFIDMEFDNICDNEKFSLITNENEDKTQSVVSIKYISFELENRILYRYKNLIDNLEEKEDNLILNYIKNINENNIENIKINSIEDSIENKLIKINLITNNDICFSNIIILYIMNIKNLKLLYNNHIYITSLFSHAKIFRNYYKMIMEVVYPLLMESIKIENYEDAENYLMIYYLYVNSLRNHRLIPNENLSKYIKKFDLIEIGEINIINEKKKEINQDLTNIENNEGYMNLIYISKNFTPKHTVTEENVLKYVNDMLGEDMKNELNTQSSKGKFKPVIKVNSGKYTIEYKILSQKEIFIEIKKIYNEYIVNKLEYDSSKYFLICEICANIIIYFKYMEEFDEKSEVNAILCEIYGFYSNLYRKQKNIE